MMTRAAAWSMSVESVVTLVLAGFGAAMLAGAAFNHGFVHVALVAFGLGFVMVIPSVVAIWMGRVR